MKPISDSYENELAAQSEQQHRARKQLSRTAKKLFGEEAEAYIAYFPMERQFRAHVWIEGKYHKLTELQPNLILCAEEAIKCLETMSACQSKNSADS